MILGTIDVYHFIPLSVTCTLVGGHKVRKKAKSLGFIFLHTD